MDIHKLRSLYADAKEEFLDNPDLFSKMYYDPKNHIGSLLTSSRYIVLGRKGTGKTALKHKFTLVAEANKSIVIDLPVSQSDFECFLDKVSVDDDFLAKSWQLYILLHACKLLKVKKIISENFGKDINELFALSNKNLLEKIKDSMTLNIILKTTPVEIGASYVNKENTRKINIDDIIKRIIEMFVKQNKSQKLYITVDSLDYFLEPNKTITKKYILSLINAVSNLNMRLTNSTISIKTILFIRDEMFSELVFQDKNKLKSDCSIELKWNVGSKPEKSDIIMMLYLRFRSSGYNGLIDEFIKDLNDYFKPTGFDFYSRFLEISLNRPRDILQYIKFCQLHDDSKGQIDSDDIKKIDHDFSEEYFMGEVKDELAGHFKDEVIQDLQTILYKLSPYRFSYNTWREVILRHNTDFNDDLVSSLLKRMFEFGFVGLINLSHDLDYVEKRKIETPVYIYEKPYIKLPSELNSSSCLYCLHRGIGKGLFEK